jgi:hypothetical protein
MNVKSKLIAGSVAAASFLAVAPAMAAVSVTGTNGTTGAQSSNTNTTNAHSSWHFSVNNHSDLNNEVNLHSNTGGNNSNKNTVGGSTSTGDVSATVDINNVANAAAGSMVFPGGDGNITVDFGNDTTGFASRNTNRLNASSSNFFSVNNNSRVDNDVSLSSNTGGNNSNKNTEGGSGISTGSVNNVITLTNASNGNDLSGLLSGMGGGSVTVSGGNSITGANSQNSNSVNLNSSNHVTVNNNSNTNNEVNVHSNTGGNNSNQNTVGGSVTTGDANSDITISNSSN